MNKYISRINNTLIYKLITFPKYTFYIFSRQINNWNLFIYKFLYQYIYIYILHDIFD